jgi:hypothetical protein
VVDTPMLEQAYAGVAALREEPRAPICPTSYRGIAMCSGTMKSEMESVLTTGARKTSEIAVGPSNILEHVLLWDQARRLVLFRCPSHIMSTVRSNTAMPFSHARSVIGAWNPTCGYRQCVNARRKRWQITCDGTKLQDKFDKRALVVHTSLLIPDRACAR